MRTFNKRSIVSDVITIFCSFVTFLLHTGCNNSYDADKPEIIDFEVRGMNVEPLKKNEIRQYAHVPPEGAEVEFIARPKDEWKLSPTCIYECASFSADNGEDPDHYHNNLPLEFSNAETFWKKVGTLETPWGIIECDGERSCTARVVFNPNATGVVRRIYLLFGNYPICHEYMIDQASIY